MALHLAHRVACKPDTEFLENLMVYLTEHDCGMDLTTI